MTIVSAPFIRKINDKNVIFYKTNTGKAVATNDGSLNNDEINGEFNAAN